MTDETPLEERHHPDKAMVYATNRRRLLIFHEPAYPDLLPQVPGGTIDPGESPSQGAAREFFEETGLVAPSDMTFLIVRDQRFPLFGYVNVVRRHFFHAHVPDDLPETWDHYERQSGDGSGPILFRFGWVGLDQAASVIAPDMGDALPALLGRIGAGG